MSKIQNKSQQVILYKNANGVAVSVVLQKDTVWLNLQQITRLFGRDKSVISRHISNIYKEGELSQTATVAKNATVQKEGGRVIKREIEYYNLDLIISVGYRVNSKQGIAFRRWSTQILKDYLIKGYVLNEARLKENTELKLKELEGTVKFLKQVVESRRLEGYEVELLNIITDYTQTWVTLNRYDLGTLKIERITKKALARLKYEEVQKTISHFKQRLQKTKEASHLFGKEVGHKLKSALGAVHQTFDGIDVYPSIEEKAAHLLYFIIKDHPFVDGNKRIGALLFLVYLIENRALYNKRGERKIESPALTTLALLVAESHTTQKEIMIKLIVNLINN